MKPKHWPIFTVLPHCSVGQLLLALRSFAFLDDKSQLGEHVLPKTEELGILARAVLNRRQIGVQDADALKSNKIKSDPAKSRIREFTRWRRRIKKAVGPTDKSDCRGSNRLVPLAADNPKRRRRIETGSARAIGKDSCGLLANRPIHQNAENAWKLFARFNANFCGRHGKHHLSQSAASIRWVEFRSRRFRLGA